ncbi:hypothetical protein FA13DRAFT_111992 [Coprinellus micaceus]|uniref:Uncharacterized protein n=1 Tax=Coprinellus micaceus TaxID=71717 RepID=A0A4Y7TID8_COPMI|nr:hypothetical protein FA13DRAFT_111992 [Coprinellus micaceus]
MAAVAANPVTTTEEIVQHADYHAKLLRTLSDLDYTPTALRQHREYIRDLEGQLVASDRKVEELAKATKKERKDHERLRDSTTRRLAAKLSGKKEKYEAEQEKEEKEYVEALHNEMAERDNNAMLQQLLAEARSTEEELVNKGKTKDNVEREIHALYNRVFEGPSESFPEEDKLEYEVNEAHKQHERAQSAVNMESLAAELLSRSTQSMERCLASVKEALSYSRYDMWGGGTMADMMERNALTNATAQASQAESFAEQAHRVNPVVQPVGRVQIAQGSLMSDVFFDNIFTDMAFHDKIKRSAAQVLLSLNRLKQERDAALQRADVAGRNISQAHQRLEDKRKELFYLRKALFESIASTATRPPSYDKVTQATAVATSAPSPSPGPMATYAPPPGPPPAFWSRESLDKAGRGPPLFPEPQTLGTAGTSAMPSPGTNEGNGPTDPELNPQPSSPRPWGTRNPYAALLAERSRSMSLNTPPQ